MFTLVYFTHVYPCLPCLPCLPGYIIIGLKDGRKSRHISEEMRERDGDEMRGGDGETEREERGRE